jgi:hypothetical protein
MKALTIDLYKANDAEDSFALHLPSDPHEFWRAEIGFGKTFAKVWRVELQSREMPPELRLIDWDAVLQRVLGAYNRSDRVIGEFEWPQVAVR